MTIPATFRTVLREFLVEPTYVPAESSDENNSSIASSDRIGWLQTILDQFEGPLLRYARRLTGDLELARDVVQETFLRALRQDPANLEGHLDRWLFHVCRNRALDVHRKEQRMSVATDLDLQAIPGPVGPADVLTGKETASRLLNLLEVLPANQQEVIRLKFQNDLKYREIAEITGLSVSNVGFQLHAGLKRLRELMKEDA